MESIIYYNEDIVNKWNYYSMLLMKIRTVKKDVTDFTMSIPLSILPGLNADFDGDEYILNVT